MDANDNRNNDDQTQRHDDAMETPLDEKAIALIEEEADASIRRDWHEDKWFFSVIDVIGVLTGSERPRRYWTDMKRRIKDEGFIEVYAKCVQLKMRASDGKQRYTEAADTETLLRIVQSVPSLKAEPIKQWLAKLGAKRLEEMTQPLDAEDASAERTTIQKPSPDAPALDWAEYFEQMAALYRRQAAYEAQLRYIDAVLEEQAEQLDEHESRLEALEEQHRMLPEILERLGPQTLTPAHQATVKNMAKRLYALTGISFGTIYDELKEAFHVGKYGDIPDASWEQVAAWFQTRIAAAEKRRNH